MKIDIILVNYGVIGDPINGYVEVTFKKTTFVKKCQVVLRTHTCYPELKSSDGSDPRDHRNQPLWDGVKDDYNYQTVNVDCFNEHYSTKDGRFTEYPPGIARFPFELLLPEKCSNTIIFGKCFLKWEIVANIIDDNDTINKSLPVECPLLFSRASPNPEPTSVKADYLNYSATINIDKNEVVQGDLINGTINFANRTNIPLALNLCTTSVLTATKPLNSAIDKKKFKSFDFEAAPGLSIFKFQCFITHLHYATASVEPFSLTNFIQLGISGVEFQNKRESKVVVPITVFVKPCDKDRMNKYSKFNGYVDPAYLKKPFYGSHKKSPPTISFDNGIEEIRMVENNKVLYIDHNQKEIFSDENLTEKYDALYPYELLTLPEGWVMGYFRNERYYANFRTKKSTWEDPRGNPPPDHIQENVTGSLSITPICSEGVGTGKGLELKVIMGKKKLKTTITKGIDPEFKTQPLKFNIDSMRNNVIVYIRENKNIVGLVNLDLSLMKYYTSTTKWYYLTSPEHQRTEYMGRIKLHIIYASSTDRPKHFETLDYFSELNLPFYATTQKFINAVKEINKIRLKNSKKEVMSIHDQKHVIFNCESFLDLFMTSEIVTRSFVQNKRRNSCPPTQKISTKVGHISINVELVSTDSKGCPTLVEVEPKKKRHSFSKGLSFSGEHKTFESERPIKATSPIESKKAVVVSRGGNEKKRELLSSDEQDDIFMGFVDSKIYGKKKRAVSVGSGTRSKSHVVKKTPLVAEPTEELTGMILLD
ncbi:WW domain-containing protein [Entamoeba marina]